MDIIVERIRLDDELMKELDPMIAAHLNELGDEDRADYDLSAYRRAQEEGRYDMYIVRDEGKVIAYLAYNYVPNPHHNNMMFAISDMVYVRPDYRGKYVLSKMMNVAEADFKRRSIKYAVMAVRPDHDFGPFLERQGYTVKDVVYGKEIVYCG